MGILGNGICLVPTAIQGDLSRDGRGWLHHRSGKRGVPPRAGGTELSGTEWLGGRGACAGVRILVSVLVADLEESVGGSQSMS